MHQITILLATTLIALWTAVTTAQEIDAQTALKVAAEKMGIENL